MSVYYNEIDKVAVHVLRTLIAEGVIADGIVDDRSIKEVSVDDLKGFTQCHWFAGGGLWSVSARSAGWRDDKPLWTASCPCQPFSVAGKGGGVNDDRHLWPDLFRIASAARPPVIVGEQVAGAAGYGWFDGVSSDLAREGYTSRAVDVPSCAVDAPHIRQRLYWVAVADPSSTRRLSPTLGGVCSETQGERPWHVEFERPFEFHGDLADANSLRSVQSQGFIQDFGGWPGDSGGDLADANHVGLEGYGRREFHEAGRQDTLGQGADADARNGSFWADHEWIACHDGKTRRTKPGLRLLVNGLPGRVGLWRIAGNAINPVVAAEVLRSLLYMEDAA